MEGKYYIKNINDEINKHEHVIFILDNNISLRYHDTRKFGRMFLTDDLSKCKGLNKLGLEPFDKNINSDYLLTKFKNEGLNIKMEEHDLEIMKKYPTPFHLYDEKGIRKNMQALKEAFAWNPGYKEYFAVKATPNPFLIDILREYGCGCDCSSYTELLLSDAMGVKGEDIMFSSNDTPAEEFAYADKLSLFRAGPHGDQRQPYRPSAWLRAGCRGRYADGGGGAPERHAPDFD